jgi:hypothetical protein
MTTYLRPLEQLRFQREVEHIHRLGPRTTGEFIAEYARRLDGFPDLQALFVEYHHLTPEMVQAADAYDFPPRSLHKVPR